MTPAEFRDAVLAEWKASPEDSMGPSLDRVLARMLDDARKARAAEISAGLRAYARESGGVAPSQVSGFILAADVIDSGEV